MATAILIDGDFFIRRMRYLLGKQTAKQAAADLHRMCREHLKQPERKHDLYRIFFYDCPPLIKKVHNPVTNQPVDFSKTGTATWRVAFHDELRKLRKVALRLGYLNERMGHWSLRPEKLKELLDGVIAVKDLIDRDVLYSVQQKGVDMRIGLDIASLSFKKQVDQIILVAGDSDFVPAAKMARREGLDFILDPMWATIRPDLHEHVDGLRSVIKRPSVPPALPSTTPPPHRVGTDS